MASDEISAKVVIKGGKEAVKDLAAVGKAADKLDGTEIEVPIGADTKKAERDIAGLMSKVDKLDSDAGTILLTSNATAIANEITDLIIDIDKLDASDPTIDIKATQINALKGDLDQVEAKIKSVNNIPIDPGRGTNPRAGMDKIVDGADQANSAVANMVGNASQDVSELVGITGSAGVAVGQLGEYFTDSAIKAKSLGQGSGEIAKNFVKAAGPIAAIAAAVAIVTESVNAFNKPAEVAAERTKELSDAMGDTTDHALAFSEVLREDAGALSDFIADANDPLGGFGTAVDEAASHIPIIGRFMKEAGVNVFDASKRAGISIYQLSKQMAGTGKTSKEFSEQLKAAFVAGLISVDEARAITEAIAKYGNAGAQAAKDLGLFNVSQDEANALLGDFLKHRDPMKFFQSDWRKLMNDLGDNGKIDTATDSLNRLSTQLNLPPQEVISLALDGIADSADKASGKWNGFGAAVEFTKGVIKDAAKDAKDLAAKQEAVSEAINNITEDWKGMADEISEQGFADAIDQFNSLSELDLAQTRQDTVSSFDDVKEAIKNAAKEVKGWQKMDLTPDSFDELRGMPDSFGDITDAVSGMRTSIQTELQAAFNTDGIKGFTDKFDFFAGQVREQFTDMFRGMGLPEDQVQAQVQRILGDLSLLPKDKTILIKLTRDQESKNALDLFKADIEAIEQANPQIDIRTKLQAGDIQGALDELNALRISEGKDPIVLQTDIDRLGAARATAEARERAATYLRNNPAQLGINVNEQDTVNQAMAARNAAQSLLYRNKVYLPIAILPSSALDAGGTAGAGGGIVAEKRPEIVNGRYLVTSPTVVPAGTRVTSGARTARILRTRGHRGLKQYDAGGTVVAGAQTFNVNVNASMVGNRFELARAVDKGVRDIRRLRGTRG